MRVAIDLPDQLFKKAKAVSSLQGVSLKQFVARAIEHELETGNLKLSSTRVSLPIVRSQRPGSVSVSPERIAALLEAEDCNSISQS